MQCWANPGRLPGGSSSLVIVLRLFMTLLFKSIFGTMNAKKMIFSINLAPWLLCFVITRIKSKVMREAGKA